MSDKLRGNQFWKLRTTHGKDKLFSDALLLWGEACKYWEWCDRSPWMRQELVKYQGYAEGYDVPIGRPYSMNGLTIYLGVSGSYFRSAKALLLDKKEEERLTDDEALLLETIEMIETVTQTQNLEGAAVGVFNANVMMRQHNLAETINNNNTGDAVVRVSVRDPKTAEDLKALDDMLK